MYFFIFILFQIDNPVTNSEDLDQTPRSVESDLGLHCLPMSQKWDARLIWVNTTIKSDHSPFPCNTKSTFKHYNQKKLPRSDCS